MKRILTIILVIIGMSAFADDTYLYWMMDAGDSDWGYVKIAYGSSYLTLSPYIGTGSANETYELTKDTYDELTEIEEISAFFANITGLGENEFVLELYSSDNELIKSSSALTYSAASEHFAIDGGMGPMISVTPYIFEVPEPTSGMLVLIGGVLMALRRKRKIVA